MSRPAGTKIKAELAMAPMVARVFMFFLFFGDHATRKPGFFKKSVRRAMNTGLSTMQQGQQRAATPQLQEETDVQALNLPWFSFEK